MQNNCWMIVNGDWTCLISDNKEICTWHRLQGRAAGILWNSLTQSQQIHVQDVMSDPIRMWSVLASIHEQKRPAARFVAYDNLFGARKEDDESLPALVTRIKGLHHAITNSRPELMTMKDLDDELMCMALVRALPMPKYQSFVTMLTLLPQFDFKTLTEACQIEHTS